MAVMAKALRKTVRKKKSQRSHIFGWTVVGLGILMCMFDLSENGEISFRMKGERCPFLNEENLCELICRLGEKSLCEICKEHPRFYAWMGEWKEAGLGLCCEEAVRLLLENQEKLEFETVWEEGEETEVDFPWIRPLWEASSGRKAAGMYGLGRSGRIFS